MNNRRNFIGNLLAAGAGFMILPPAANGRVWKATRPAIQRCGFNWVVEDRPLMVLGDDFTCCVKPFSEFQEVIFHERES